MTQKCKINVKISVSMPGCMGINTYKTAIYTGGTGIANVLSRYILKSADALEEER